jgi:hypothetical protein
MPMGSKVLQQIASRVAVAVYGDDHFHLDRDGDGIGCDDR